MFCSCKEIFVMVFFFSQGIEDLLARGGSKKILPVIPQLIIPIKCDHYYAKDVMIFMIIPIKCDHYYAKN